MPTAAARIDPSIATRKDRAQKLFATRSATHGIVEIRSAWFAEEVELRPPWYGFEGLFPANLSTHPEFQRMDNRRTALVSHQRVAHVTGSAGNVRHAALFLRQTLYVHGARWRMLVHPLCLALNHDDGPKHEARECNRSATGPFHASVWVPLLASRPAPPRHPYRQQWARLPTDARALHRYLDRPCEWLLPLLTARNEEHDFQWRGGLADHVRSRCAQHAAHQRIASERAGIVGHAGDGYELHIHVEYEDAVQHPIDEKECLEAIGGHGQEGDLVRRDQRRENDRDRRRRVPIWHQLVRGSICHQRSPTCWTARVVSSRGKLDCRS